MKKKAEILGILIATGVVLSVNAFYQNRTDRKAGSAQPKITTSTQAATASQSVKPQSTASTTSLEQKEEPTAEKEKYALWYYDKKTRRLTISGNGELFDESPDNAADPDIGKITYRVNNMYPEDFYNSNAEEAREVVIEPGITVINTSAFYYFKKLEKVTIPDSVRKIKKYAFYGCESLKEITIPDHVEMIGEQCFYRCDSLKKITLGKRVAQIGAAAFGECPKIRKVTVNSKNKHLTTRQGSLYHKQKKIFYLNYSKPRKIIVKKGTKKIAAFACQSNKNLRQITIPASVTVIGGGAMYQCTNLRKVNFAKGSKLKKIKEFYRWDRISGYYDCFYYCKHLEQISLPESLESIQSFFVGCSRLKRIYFGKSLKEAEADIDSDSLLEIIVSKNNQTYRSIDGVLYDKKAKILYKYPSKKKTVRFQVPKSVKKISYCAFTKCKNLKSVVIYGKKTKLDSNSFQGSKHITIYAPKNSNAQKYAKKHKMKFVAI